VTVNTRATAHCEFSLQQTFQPRSFCPVLAMYEFRDSAQIGTYRFEELLANEVAHTIEHATGSGGRM